MAIASLLVEADLDNLGHLAGQQRGQPTAGRVAGAGQLLLDHVAGLPRWLQAIQRLLELVTRPATGDHQLRPPLLQVQAEGFEVERRERSKLGMVEWLAARKPSEGGRGPRTALP